MPADESAPALALADLRRAGPADTTLQNLLRVAVAKLELCGHLPIYEYEAKVEGHAAAAEVFRNLAEAERTSFRTLSECLSRHLDNGAPVRVSSTPGAGHRSGQ